MLNPGWINHSVKVSSKSLSDVRLWIDELHEAVPSAYQLFDREDRRTESGRRRPCSSDERSTLPQCRGTWRWLSQLLTPTTWRGTWSSSVTWRKSALQWTCAASSQSAYSYTRHSTRILLAITTGKTTEIQRVIGQTSGIFGSLLKLAR